MKTFHEMGIDVPIQICEDSQSAIKVAENPVLHPRSKHMLIYYHFTRECLCLLREYFTFNYIPTDENLADLMTKSLE